MTTTYEERQAPADTIVPCPTWCDKNHAIDTLDNSGVHSFVSSTEPLEVKISQGFGDGIVDPPLIAFEGAELGTKGCLAFVQSLIYAALLMDEVVPKD